jgi:hypothetical protein
MAGLVNILLFHWHNGTVTASAIDSDTTGFNMNHDAYIIIFTSSASPL